MKFRKRKQPKYDPIPDILLLKQELHKAWMHDGPKQAYERLIEWAEDKTSA